MSLYNVLKFMKLYTLRNTHFSLVIYKTVFFFFSKRDIKQNLKKRILIFNFILKCWFKSRNQRQVVTIDFSHLITESCIRVRMLWALWEQSQVTDCQSLDALTAVNRQSVVPVDQKYFFVKYSTWLFTLPNTPRSCQSLTFLRIL